MKINKIVSIFLGSIFLVSCNVHSHTFETAWTFDNDYHWHKATCEHQDEISEKAKHSFGNDGVCTVCQFDSINHKVTLEEWGAAFGPNTIYGISDNYLFDIVTGTKENPINASYVIDGNKMKEDDSSYYLVENNKLYNFTQIGSYWKKSLTDESPKDIIGSYIFLIGSYDSYEYDSTIKGYYCKSKSLDSGTIENIVVKFNNKKLVGWSAVLKNSEVEGIVNVNITYGGQTVNMPTLPKVKLMGSFDGWSQGYDMQLVEGSASRYAINSIDINSGTKIRVKINDEYVNKWVINKGTAVDNNVVVIDDESIGTVLVGGKFNIIYEADPEVEDFGVCIFVEKITPPYNIYISYKNSDGKFVYSTLETKFSKVVLNGDEKYVEYKRTECETHQGYSYSVVTFDTPDVPKIIPVTLLPGGESDKFTKDGDYYVYNGDANHVDFYIRVSLNDSTASIYVEKMIERTY